MNNALVFDEVKNSFCSLWKYKERGETLEIITPFTTPNNKFISVFITYRKDTYVITDGGWLFSGEYYDSDLVETKGFGSMLKYFESFYELREVDHYGTKFFYKTTDDIEMIPNKVHDISQFISQIVTAYALSNSENPRDTKEVERFRSEADNFILGFIDKLKIKTSQSLGEDFESVRFNAVVTYGNNFSLVKYVTGASFDYYRRSLTNASADFEIANNSKYNSLIRNRIAVINDSAPGYEVRKVVPYINLLENHIQHSVTFWSQRERLYNLL